MVNLPFLPLTHWCMDVSAEGSNLLGIALSQHRSVLCWSQGKSDLFPSCPAHARHSLLPFTPLLLASWAQVGLNGGLGTAEH